MNETEVKNSLSTEKGVFLENMVNLLREAAKTEDPQSYKVFKNDSHFQKLRIESKYFIRNSFDRDLHKKFLSYLDNIGIKTTVDEEKDIIEYFDNKDFEKRKSTLISYAQNGLLTLKTVIDKGLLRDTSSTPGDCSSLEDLTYFKNDELNNIRGYELTSNTINEAVFYGRNSFFKVVMERNGEEIDRSEKLPKLEVENRLKNSMIFVIKADKIRLSRKTENAHHEDITSQDIQPNEIDYLLVDNANLSLAQETFNHLSTKTIGVETIEADIQGLYNGPYQLPDYKGKLEEIVNQEGSIWCHIARLPVDTYPKEPPTTSR